MKYRFLLACVVACAMAAMLACGEKTPTSATQAANNQTQVTRGTGQLRVYIKDAPAETITAVLVTVSGVTAHVADDGAWGSLTLAGGGTQLTCDLLKLTGGVEQVLADANLTAGHYTQIRLNVDDARVYLEPIAFVPPCQAGAIPTALSTEGFNVKVPSGTIKLNHQFTLDATAPVNLVLDFDAAKSIHQLGNGNWQMQPVIAVSAK